MMMLRKMRMMTSKSRWWPINDKHLRKCIYSYRKLTFFSIFQIYDINFGNNFSKEPLSKFDDGASRMDVIITKVRTNERRGEFHQ